jgi:glycosyltransferase involved in cell wall biosynthesis
MRQVFVLPQDRRSPSGGNLYNRFLLKALRARGFAFSVLTIETALRDARRARPTRYWLDSLLLDRMAELRTLAAASSECYVIVHYFPSLQPALGARARSAWRRLEDTAFTSADGFLATSDFAAAELAGRGTGTRPLLVVPPAPVVTPGPAARARAPGFRALMVANLVPGKGVLEFLEAFAPRAPGGDFSLEIAGSGDADTPYAERCRRVVARHEALRGRVRFLGALSLASLRRAYERNTFFISASRMESFGMALGEARAFGLYLLAREAGNVANLVAAPIGEVFTSDDTLAARAARIAGDAALAGRLRGAMPAPAPGASWGETAALFLAQLPVPQRRTARNEIPPRKLRGATKRPATSSTSRAAAHARGMSPRGTKVQ